MIVLLGDVSVSPIGRSLLARLLVLPFFPLLPLLLLPFFLEQSFCRGERGHIHRLLTTLLDPEQAPALDLIRCYHERWEIEEIIGETKTSLRFTHDPMRSQDPTLVYQAFYGLLLAQYAVRAWMFESATQAGLDSDQLSFTHAVEVLHQACAQSRLAHDDPAHFTQRILSDLREPSCLLPPRRFRFSPRVLKRAQASFIRKRPHHEGFELKNTSFRDVLLI